MMQGIYWTPISRVLEIVLGIGAIAIVYLMARSFMSKHAWGDGAQYEMLGLEVPEDVGEDGAGDLDLRQDVRAGLAVKELEHDKDEAVLQGLIGLEDRIVRFGFTIALTYLSITWFGIRSMAMWLLALPVLYLLVTAFVGKDPIYRRLGLTTQFD